MDNELALQLMCKTYTNDAFYRPIGAAMRTGDYQSIQNYMNIILENQNKFGHLYSVQAVHLPVYRGLNPTGFKHEDYQPKSIGYWPQFTSTTKCIDTAKGFSR